MQMYTLKSIFHKFVKIQLQACMILVLSAAAFRGHQESLCPRDHRGSLVQRVLPPCKVVVVSVVCVGRPGLVALAD